MENITYKAIFHEHGFEAGKDVSEAELMRLRELFMAMYELFTTGVNSVMEKVNETWEKYEYIKENGDIFSIIALQRVMGITSETQYNDWLEKWYKELANSVDMGFKWAPLKSRIFRDGELPVYGVAFKEHPEWTMDFTIEELR